MQIKSADPYISSLINVPTEWWYVVFALSITLSTGKRIPECQERIRAANELKRLPLRTFHYPYSVLLPCLEDCWHAFVCILLRYFFFFFLSIIELGKKRGIERLPRIENSLFICSKRRTSGDDISSPYFPNRRVLVSDGESIMTVLRQYQMESDHIEELFLDENRNIIR